LGDVSYKFIYISNAWVNSVSERSGCDESLVINKCGSLKPCVHGSDAHCEDKLFNPDENRFCWIKADLTFEGLKQILCEPKDRVKIQATKPEEKSGYHVIKSIEIDSNIYNVHQNHEHKVLTNHIY
jgi:hypothetical protein